MNFKGEQVLAHAHGIRRAKAESRRDSRQQRCSIGTR